MVQGRIRLISLCLIWLVFGLGLPLLAPTLNGLKPAGLPAGFWFAAQGAPLILAAVLAWTSGRGRA